MRKGDLRRLMHQAASNIPDRVWRSVEVWALVADTAEYRQATTVLAYASLPTEVDTAGLCARVVADGKVLMLPRVEGDHLVAVVDRGEYRSGYAGIREPRGEPVDPTSIDVCVVPGLAFTSAGHRLGRGGGHYDRFLTGLPAATIGVCFAEQLVDELPVEAHDVVMQRVLTA